MFDCLEAVAYYFDKGGRALQKLSSTAPVPEQCEGRSARMGATSRAHRPAYALRHRRHRLCRRYARGDAKRYMVWVSSTSSVLENSGTLRRVPLVHDARHVRVYGAMTTRSTSARRDPLTEKPHGAAGKPPLVVCSTLPLVGQGAPFGASGERVWPCALSRPFIFV